MMKIGEVIRTYRRERQLTQEEMANRLGVTAPAVNKWENGVSCPDVALLAPIARLLGITTDTLLSYREELSDQEINEIAEALPKKMREDGYDAAFAWAEQQIREYPNCMLLIATLTQILDGYRRICQIPEPERYEERLHALYLRILESKDADMVQVAVVALFQNALIKKDYDAAEAYLERLPKRGVNPAQLRANLRLEQDRKEEAYELYERILLSCFSDAGGAFNGLLNLAQKEGDQKKAEFLMKKQKQLAQVLEMGAYMEISAELPLAAQSGDKAWLLKVLSELVTNLKEMNAYRRSSLYEHLKSQEADYSEIGYILSQALEHEESLDGVREEPEYQRLMEKLKKTGI